MGIALTCHALSLKGGIFKPMWINHFLQDLFNIDKRTKMFILKIFYLKKKRSIPRKKLEYA